MFVTTYENYYQINYEKYGMESFTIFQIKIYLKKIIDVSIIFQMYND